MWTAASDLRGFLSFILQSILIGSSVSLAALFSYVIYQRYFHPLAKYPGPFLASFSNLWSVQLARSGQWPQIMQDLHNRCGPIIRIAPNEVDIDDPAAIKVIYGLKSGFTKTPFYAVFGDPSDPQPNLFSVPDERWHSERRSWVGAAYSMKGMLQYEDLIKDCIRRLVTVWTARAQASANHIDMAAALKEFAFDTSSAIGLGEHLNAIEKGDIHGALHSISNIQITSSILGRIPWIRHILFHPFVMSRVPKNLPMVKGLDYLRGQTERQMKAHLDPNSGVDWHDFMTFFLSKSSEEISEFEKERVRSESVVLVAAGSDTTGSTLAALMYYVCAYPQVYQRLQQEVDDCIRSNAATDIMGADIVAELPYLNAVIKEALRVHPGVGFPLPRFVPKGGKEICGQFYPEGTSVGVNAWHVHKHADVFGEHPEKFIPERWLTNKNAPDAAAEDERLRVLDRNLFSFGGGARVCIGKNISLLEMRLVIPELLRHFDIKLVDPTAPFTFKTHWFTFCDGLPTVVTLRK